MKIQLPSKSDVRDGALQLADDARQAAADAADQLSNRALELGINGTEAAKDFADETSVAVMDLGRDAEKAARDFGNDASKAAREAADDLGKRAEQAPKDIGSAAEDFGKGLAKGFRRLPSVIGGAVRPVPDETRRLVDPLLAAAASGALSVAGRLAKASGRAIVMRRPSPFMRAGFAIPMVGIVIVAAGTGAVLAYAFDPVSGRARRARARDQFMAGARRLGRRLGRAQRYATSTVAGKIEQVRMATREIAAETTPRTAHTSEHGVADTRPTAMVGVMSGDAAAGNGLA